MGETVDLSQVSYDRDGRGEAANTEPDGTFTPDLEPERYSADWKDVLPAWAKTPAKRAALARQIKARIDAYRAVYDNVRDRYRVNEEYVLNIPDASRDPDNGGLPICHIPVVQPKCDAQVANVCQQLFMSKPYVRVQRESVTGDDDGDLDPRTMVDEYLSRLLEASGCYRATKRAGRQAFWSDLGIIKTSWKPGRARLEFRTVRPEDFVIYPVTARHVEDAVMVGDRVTVLRSEIVAQGKSGDVFSYPRIVNSTDADERTEPLSGEPDVRHKAADGSMDEPVSKYLLYLKVAGEWWYVSFLYDDEKVLRVERDPVQGSRCYARFSWNDEWTNSYVPVTSRAQDLQGIQTIVNQDESLIIEGTRMNVMGVHFMGGLTSLDSDWKRVRAGDMVPVMADVQSFSPKADLSYLPQHQSALIRYADAVSRVTQMASGGSGGADSATEASGMMAGQNVGFTDDAVVFGSGLVDLATHAADLMVANAADWVDTGNEQDAMVLEALRARPTFELSIASASAHPTTQMAMLREMLTAATQVPETGAKTYDIFRQMALLAQRVAGIDPTEIQTTREEMQAQQAQAALNQTVMGLLEQQAGQDVSGGQATAGAGPPGGESVAMGGEEAFGMPPQSGVASVGDSGREVAG